MEDDEKAEVAEYKRKLRAEVGFWNVLTYILLVVGGLWATYDLFYGSPSARQVRLSLVIIIICVYGFFRFLYECFKRFMGADWED
jgi:hypothetical protein